MKKIILLICILPLISIAQGLNFENAYNSGHFQFPSYINTTNTFSYLTYIERHLNGNKLHFLKTDTTGQVHWRKIINPSNLDNVYIKSIFETNNGNIVAIGDGREVCDVGGLYHHFLIVLNSNGDILYTYDAMNFTTSYQYGIKGTGINRTMHEVYFGIDKSDTSRVFRFNYYTFQIDSTEIAMDSISHHNMLTNGHHLTSSKDSLVEIDNNSQIYQVIKYSSNIKTLQERNDSIFVMTTDSVFIYDNNLNLLQENNINSANQLTQLYLSTNKVHVLNNDNGTLTAFELSPNLQIQNASSITLNNYQPQDFISFSQTNLNHSQDFDLHEKTSVRHYNYSLLDPSDSLPTYPDVSIIDIEKLSITDLSSIAQNTYEFDLEARVKVKNNSNEVINAVRINHYISIWFCGDVYFSQEFDNLSIQPGQSIWVTLNPILHQETIQGNPIEYEFCAYTSHPNRKTDINIGNDNYCKNLHLGFVGIQDHLKTTTNIFPNPATQNVIITSGAVLENYSIYNTMGQPVQQGILKNNRINVENLPHGLYILELKNGNQSVSKKLIIE